MTSEAKFCDLSQHKNGCYIFKILGRACTSAHSVIHMYQSKYFPKHKISRTVRFGSTAKIRVEMTRRRIIKCDLTISIFFEKRSRMPSVRRHFSDIPARCCRPIQGTRNPQNFMPWHTGPPFGRNLSKTPLLCRLYVCFVPENFWIPGDRSRRGRFMTIPRHHLVLIVVHRFPSRDRP
jgi:hypothetical protein